MNDLILTINNTPVLNTATASKLAELDALIKELKNKQDEIKKAIKDEMRSKNIIKVENELLSITYIYPTDREEFDKKRFKKDHPDLYDEYVDLTPVSDSIRVKVKDNEHVEN